MAKFYCIKECNTYNKRFKPGDEFPQKWLDEHYLPNHHFKQFDSQKDAIAYFKETSETRPIQCAGDDPRSNEQLRTALAKYTNVSEKWTRKEIWMKLRERETADERTEQPKPKK